MILGIPAGIVKPDRIISLDVKTNKIVQVVKPEKESNPKKDNQELQSNSVSIKLLS